jgi:hypothetical protein
MAGEPGRRWTRLRCLWRGGGSGVWLRAGSRLGLACRGAVYLLVGYLAFRLALASHGRTGAPASSAGAVQAAVPARGDVFRWCCWSPGSPRTRSPSCLKQCSGLPAPKRDGQVAAACGVVVGVPAVLSVLPEHRPAPGGNPCEADGAVGAAAGYRDGRGLAGPDRCLPGQDRGAVQRGPGEGARRGLPFGGQLTVRPVAAGAAEAKARDGQAQATRWPPCRRPRPRHFLGQGRPAQAEHASAGRPQRRRPAGSDHPDLHHRCS